MATTASPYGARPVGTLSASGSFTSKTRHLPIITTYGTQISNGDFCKVAADGTIAKDVGTTSLTAVGIFLGCSYTDPTTGQKTFSNYWPASNAATDAMAYVLDDPYVLIQMQADEAMNTTDRGLNASVVVTAGSATFGKSKNALDGSTPATTATLPLRIISFVDGPKSLPPVGTTASDAFPDVIVKFNAPSSFTVSPHMYLNCLGV
jgi:hypothetical protein